MSNNQTPNNSLNLNFKDPVINAMYQTNETFRAQVDNELMADTGFSANIKAARDEERQRIKSIMRPFTPQSAGWNTAKAIALNSDLTVEQAENILVDVTMAAGETLFNSDVFNAAMDSARADKGDVFNAAMDAQRAEQAANLLKNR